MDRPSGEAVRTRPSSVRQPGKPRLFTPDSLLGSLGAFGGAVVAGRVLGFIRGVALAWLVAIGDFGLFTVALALVNILMPLCSLGLPEGLMRYAPAHEAGGSLRWFLRRAVPMTLLVGVVGAGLLVILAGPLGGPLFATGAVVPTAADTVAAPDPIGSSRTGVVRMVALCVFGLVVYHVVAEQMKGLRLFRAAGLMEITGTVLFTVLSVGVAWAGFKTAGALLLSYAVASVASAALFTPALLRCIRGHRAEPITTPVRAAWRGQLLRYSVWMGATAVLWYGLQTYAFWHLLKVGGGEAAGAFHAVRMFAVVLLWGAMTAAKVVSSHVNRRWETAERDQALTWLSAATKVALLAMMAGAVMMSLTKGWLLGLFRPEYGLGLGCFDIMLAGHCLFGATAVLAVRFYLAEQSMLSAWTSFAGLLVSVVCALWILGRPGAPAASEDAALLVRAGWVCVAGACVSVATCLALQAWRGLKLSPATVVIVIAMTAVGAGGIWGLFVLVVLVAMSMARVGLFSESERVTIRYWLRR